jgi:hypothetical protein
LAVLENQVKAVVLEYAWIVAKFPWVLEITAGAVAHPD